MKEHASQYGGRWWRREGGTYGLSVDFSLPRPVLFELLPNLLVIDQFKRIALPIRCHREDVLNVCQSGEEMEENEEKKKEKKGMKSQCYSLVATSKRAENERTISPDKIEASDSAIVGLTIDDRVSKEEFSRALKPRVESRNQVGAHEHYKNTSGVSPKAREDSGEVSAYLESIR